MKAKSTWITATRCGGTSSIHIDNSLTCLACLAMLWIALFPSLLTCLNSITSNWRPYYKVEFIQSFFWFYFVPNLLVIQHLETLYLGGNHIRVVCERVWRKAQKCALKKSLMTSLRLASRQRRHTCEACRGSWRFMPAVALQDKTSGWPGS